MNILVTGAKGFVGKNLCARLHTIAGGKNRCYEGLTIDRIFEYDIDSSLKELDTYCREADFVFNLAGVNRPQSNEEFMQGNYGFASTLLDLLRRHNNLCPVMLSSSIQATLVGRYGEGDYGKSKRAGEELFFDYAATTGAKVLVYRFPNLFGKWCRPNYNSAVATFCHNIAHDLPITVNDRSTLLELLYIDDLVDEMIAALQGKEHRCEFEGIETILTPNGRYCVAPITHKVTLGKIVDLLNSFHAQSTTLVMPEIGYNTFAKKLYTTYISYLPREHIAYPLKMNLDERGSFTEIMRTEKCGQMSVNISKPGITKGEHWHDSKWEMFVVVSGHGMIEMRPLNGNEIVRFEVSGEKIEVVQTLPGYTHNIVNLSDTDDLITIIWANEAFDPQHPDTFYEKVNK